MTTQETRSIVKGLALAVGSSVVRLASMLGEGADAIRQTVTGFHYCPSLDADVYGPKETCERCSRDYQ